VRPEPWRTAPLRLLFRFGLSVRSERVAFAQASDRYSSEVLAALAADTHGG
jgi:hypothetical protein